MSTKSHFVVCQHLENVSLGALEKYQFAIQGNQQMGKLPRSEDLRRKLGAEIRKYQREEFKDLIGRELGPKKEVVPEAAAEMPRRPVLAPYTQKPLRLRARFKEKLLSAQVRRDGRLRFAGTLYDSPSLAGATACQRRTCNGWKFWEDERASGDWVLLDELRR